MHAGTNRPCTQVLLLLRRHVGQRARPPVASNSPPHHQHAPSPQGHQWGGHPAGPRSLCRRCAHVCVCWRERVTAKEHPVGFQLICKSGLPYCLFPHLPCVQPEGTGPHTHRTRPAVDVHRPHVQPASPMLPTWQFLPVRACFQLFQTPHQKISHCT